MVWIEKCYLREISISLPNLWKNAKIYSYQKSLSTLGNSDEFNQAVCTKVISSRLNSHTTYERTFENQKLDYILSNLRENADVCCQDIIKSFQESVGKNVF